MATISPEAQALIDRLHAADIARPRVDPEAVEKAFNRQRAAVGLEPHPVRQMPDATSGYRYVIGPRRPGPPRRLRPGTEAPWPVATLRMAALSKSPRKS
jgi:hypothetical protein